MNSEHFNRALNEISDDLIDGAVAVYDKKTHRKGRILPFVWVACALLVLTVIGVFGNVLTGATDPTQSTISVEKPTTRPETTEPTQQDIIVHTGNVYFLTATEERAELVPVRADMTVPWDHMLHVRNLKGMTQEQRLEAINDERQAQMAFHEKYGLLIGEGRYAVYYSENAIIRYYRAGGASLILLNNSEIESVERETTGILSIGRRHSTLPEDYTIGKGEYSVTIPGGSRRIYLDFALTEAARRIFEENPETPLSAIRETITITINYKNGTKEIVVIDVTVDNDGQICMTQRGENTGA